LLHPAVLKLYSIPNAAVKVKSTFITLLDWAEHVKQNLLCVS